MLELTNGQKEAKMLAFFWFSNENKQVFEIAGYAGCLDKDTMILTSQGYMTLEDLIILSGNNPGTFLGFNENKNKELKVFNGTEFTEFSHVYATDLMTGYKIKTRNGRELKMSEIHPLMTISKNNKSEGWTKASLLEIGDKIACLGNKCIYDDKDIIQYSTKKDLFFFLGFLINNGYIDNSNNRIVIQAEQEKLLVIDNLLEEIFHSYYKDNKKIFKRKNKDYLYFYLTSYIRNILYRTFKKAFFTDDTHLNILDFHGRDIDTLKAKFNFLSGIIYGVKNKNNEFKLDFKDKKIYDYFTNSMLEFGISFNYKEEKRIFRKSIHSAILNYSSFKNFEYYFWNVLDIDKKLYKLKNNNNDTYSYSINGLNENYIFDEIISIKEIRQYFFDITVPKGNCFVSNGIISHNTGKSTIVNLLIEDFNLKPEEVCFATYTGKAALVLQQKKIPAVTIHKLIYNYIEKEVPVLDEKGRQVKDENGDPLYEEKFVFEKKDFLETGESNIPIRLIVIDECSMISEELWKDLLSFDKPIIVLGDPGQLPPIEGESPLLKNPDVFLTEIMRQAEDNPIIYLATLAREKKKIKLGNYGKSSVVDIKYFNDDLFNNYSNCDDILKKASIVICGKNKTREYINKHFREVLFELDTPFPVQNDKIICRRNNYQISIEYEGLSLPLINGMIGYSLNDINPTINWKKDTYSLNFRPEFIKNFAFGNLTCDIFPFKNIEGKTKEDIKQMRAISYDKQKDYKRNEIQLFEYAYAITAHLSQGSSWKKPVIYDEWLSLDKDYHAKWLYTAITRAEIGTAIFKKPW